MSSRLIGVVTGVAREEAEHDEATEATPLSRDTAERIFDVLTQ